MRFEYTPEQVLAILRKQGETKRIEAKKASEIGDSIMQTVCAFANTIGLKGGYLLLGVSEPDKDHDNFWVSGLKDLDKLFNNLHTNCRDQFETPISIDVQKHKLEGAWVALIYVPELEASAKPCAFKGKPEKGKNKNKTGVWLRGINGDFEATQSDLTPILLAKAGKSFEQVYLSDCEWEDLDPNAIRRYRELRAKVHATAPELAENDQEMLYALGVVDRKKEYQPNIAGLVLFGKATALRRLYPSVQIDYVRVAGTEWVQDHFIETFDLLEALIFSIVKMENKILSNIPLQFRLEPNQLQRRDTPLLPYQVIRETLVNAVMHKDYQVKSPIIIAHYNDRLEMKNAGYSLKPQDELDKLGSERRNTIIAQVLYDLHFAETKGSGIGKIYRELKQANLKEPQFESNLPANYFKATYLFSQLLDPVLLTWLGNFKAFNLTQDEVRALVLAHKESSVSNETLRELSDLTAGNAGGVLKALVVKNLLAQHGTGRGTFYTLTDYAKSYLPVELNVNTTKLNLDKTGLNTSLSVELDTGENLPKVDNSRDTAQIPPSLSVELNADKGGLNPLSVELNGLPVELVYKLNNLGQRTTPDKLKNALLALCDVKPMSLTNLTAYTRRKDKTLRPILKGLVEQKQLQYRYPDSPTHPDQAYLTTEHGKAQLTMENNHAL